jgi:choline dehydrogenase-like flavoprotein
VSVVKADACVIGTGAGGAPVAKELAEGGMSVVMLEEGPDRGADDVTARPREMTARLYRDAGQLATVGNVPIVLPLGSGIGGTTFVNSGTCFRTPDAVLERWATDFGLDGMSPPALDPFFARVDEEIGVTQVTPDIAGNNAPVVRRGAERLGWSGDFIRRNASGCVGSGVCAFGCPTAAKQHTGVTYVPRARAAGAVTYTGCRARRIELRGGRARAVEAGHLRVEADHVIVACGAIHTPLLLERNGLGAGSGMLGRNLSIHPATAVRALFDEEINMSRGVPQSYYVDQFAGEGIMFEGAAGPPDYLAMSFPFSRERLREVMLRYKHLAQFGVMISDRSRGSVRARGGRVAIRYDLCREDRGRLARGVELMGELYRTAGAREIYPPRPDDVMAFHPLGTARADADASRGVVDGDLKVHGVEGLYVADGSVVPSSLG